MYDINKIVNDNPIASVVGQYTDLKKDGHEYRGLCPFHSERSPSFTVMPHKGKYHCFGCGAHGSVIDFVMEKHGVGFKEACRMLNGEVLDTSGFLVIGCLKDKNKKHKDIYADFTIVGGDMRIIKGTPCKIYNIKKGEWKQYRPTEVYPYKNIKGDTIGYVFRIMVNGKKMTLPAQNVQRNGKVFPAIMPFSKLRPLYGMETYTDDGFIFIVEGEKTADALRKLLPTHMVISWPTGSKSVKYADWGSLPKGRKYIMIPDADGKCYPNTTCLMGWDEQIGWLAMKEVESLLPSPEKTRIVNTHHMSSVKDGWDIADADFTTATFKEWLLESWTK